MNEYDVRITELSEKYCVPVKSINQEYGHFEVYLNRMIELLSEGNSSDKCVIWGAGDYTKRILADRRIDRGKIAYIVDIQEGLWGQKIEEIEICSPQALLKVTIKRIIICIENASTMEKVKQQVELLGIKAKIDSFHLYENGMPCYVMFNRNIEVFKQKYLFLHQVGIEQKQALECLIAEYLCLRDFKYTIQYIDTYIEMYHDNQGYMKLKEGINQILYEIRTQLKARKEKDVLFILYDNLGSKHLNRDCPYLNELRMSGLSYSNAYAPSIHTLESMCASHYKEMTFQKSSYHEEIGNLKSEERGDRTSQIIESMGEKGYEVGYFGSAYTIESIGRRKFHKINEKLRYTGQVFWNSIIELCVSTDKQFHYIYTSNGTHRPYLAGNHDVATKEFELTYPGQVYDEFIEKSVKPETERQKILNKRYREAMEYIDELSEFYISMLPSQTIKIITADHARNIDVACIASHEENFLAHSACYHVPLIVHGREIDKYVHKGVVATFYLKEMIESFIKREVYVSSTGIALNGFGGWRKKALVNELDANDEYEVSCGYCLVLDEHYKLVCDSNYKLHYHEMKNETVEVLDEDLKLKIHHRLYQRFEEYYPEVAAIVCKEVRMEN